METYILWLILETGAFALGRYPGVDGLENCKKEELYVGQSAAIPQLQLICIKTVEKQ